MKHYTEYSNIIELYEQNKDKIFMKESGKYSPNIENMDKWIENIKNTSFEYDIKRKYVIFAKFLKVVFQCGYVSFKEYIDRISLIADEIIVLMNTKNYDNKMKGKTMQIQRMNAQVPQMSNNRNGSQNVANQQQGSSQPAFGLKFKSPLGNIKQKICSLNLLFKRICNLFSSESATVKSESKSREFFECFGELTDEQIKRYNKTVKPDVNPYEDFARAKVGLPSKFDL